MSGIRIARVRGGGLAFEFPRVLIALSFTAWSLKAAYLYSTPGESFENLRIR